MPLEGLISCPGVHREERETTERGDSEKKIDMEALVGEE